MPIYDYSIFKKLYLLNKFNTEKYYSIFLHYPIRPGLVKEIQRKRYAIGHQNCSLTMFLHFKVHFRKLLHFPMYSTVLYNVYVSKTDLFVFSTIFVDSGYGSTHLRTKNKVTGVTVIHMSIFFCLGTNILYVYYVVTDGRQ